MANLIKRVLGKNDMTKTDIVFTAVVLGSMALFGTGNALVTKQLLELKQQRAELEERRVDMCLTYKVYAVVYHFNNTEMMGYCWKETYDLPPITPLPVPGQDS